MLYLSKTEKPKPGLERHLTVSVRIELMICKSFSEKVFKVTWEIVVTEVTQQSPSSLSKSLIVYNGDRRLCCFSFNQKS